MSRVIKLVCDQIAQHDPIYHRVGSTILRLYESGQCSNLKRAVDELDALVKRIPRIPSDIGVSFGLACRDGKWGKEAAAFSVQVITEKYGTVVGNAYSNFMYGQF